MQEQIFISYRRDGGDVTAKLICEALKNRGYSVFYDYDSLQGGYFDERIFEAINACTDFVLVLPEKSLDRCENTDDWVRKEIAYALKREKNIIPVMLSGFTFPANLPKEIENVSRINGVQFVMSYFDGVMDAICNRIIATPDSRINKDKKSTASSTSPQQSLIRNVCTFGSCDFENTSPSDAFYSETIDRNKYNIVYFRILTAKMKNKSSIKTHFIIYDSNNGIVFDDVYDFAWQDDYNLLTLSWVIRDKDGTFVKAGTYKAVFQIENSAEYEYHFTITAQETTSPQNDNLKNISSKQKWAQIFQSSPKSFLLFLVTSISLLYSLGDSWCIDGIIALLLGISLWVILFIRTKKYVSKNIFLSLLLMTIGFIYYGIFLLVASIINLFKKLVSSIANLFRNSK